MQFLYQLLIFGKYILRSEVISTDVFNVWKKLLNYEDYNLFSLSNKNNVVLHINLVFSVLEYLHGYEIP